MRTLEIQYAEGYVHGVEEVGAISLMLRKGAAPAPMACFLTMAVKCNQSVVYRKDERVKATKHGNGSQPTDIGSVCQEHES